MSVNPRVTSITCLTPETNQALCTVRRWLVNQPILVKHQLVTFAVGSEFSLS